MEINLTKSQVSHIYNLSKKVDLNALFAYLNGSVNFQELKDMFDKEYLMTLNGKIYITDKYKQEFENVEPEIKNKEGELEGDFLILWKALINEEIWGKKKKNLANYFGDVLIAKYYHLYVNIFPTVGGGNKLWDNYFRPPKAPAKLRQDTTNLRKAFKALIFKKEAIDVRYYVIAALKYMKNAINDRGVFSTTVLNYTRELAEDSALEESTSNGMVVEKKKSYEADL